MKFSSKSKICLYIGLAGFFLALGWVPNFSYYVGLGAKDAVPDHFKRIFMSVVTIIGLAVAVYYVDKDIG